MNVVGSRPIPIGRSDWSFAVVTSVALFEAKSDAATKSDSKMADELGLHCPNSYEKALVENPVNTGILDGYIESNRPRSSRSDIHREATLAQRLLVFAVDVGKNQVITASASSRKLPPAT